MAAQLAPSKINDIKKKIKNEEHKLKAVKWQIYSVHIVKDSIQFWKFQPDFFIAIDGKCISDIHWNQKNAFFDAKEFDGQFLDEKNNELEVWHWKAKGRSEKQFSIPFDLKKYRKEGKNKIDIKGKYGAKFSYEVKLKRCD